MKHCLLICLGILAHVSSLCGFSLPDEIVLSFRRDGQRIPASEELYGEQKAFIDYISKNWRSLAENIESLPPKDGEDIPGVKFNVSVIRLGYACSHLPPEEYVDFFEQIVSLYEQKRISLTAFENIYSGADRKRDFWTVNWEHPRVQAIFTRIRKFDPPPRESLMAFIEDQACGKLADSYMHDLPDDTPPPETLPGIKLQRPWASVIRKYEALTGKRVPPDPGFPDHRKTRPSRKGLQEQEAAGPGTLLAEQVKPWWTRPEPLIFSIIAVVLTVILWLRRSKRSA